MVGWGKCFILLRVCVARFQARQELDKAKRKQEVELRDIQQQLEEANRRIADLESQLKQTQAELQSANQRIESELNAKAALEKSKRQLESQVADLQEDFDTEKAAHDKAEKQRRALQEVSMVLPDQVFSVGFFKACCGILSHVPFVMIGKV